MQTGKAKADSPPATRGWWCVVAAIAFGALSVSQSGCVSRRLTIRSNPPGARVYVDNYEIGTTPCSTAFTYYGTRQIRLVKDGYETLTVEQEIPAPGYQIPPFDFVSENLNPREIRDERTLTYDLRPQIIVPTGELLGRAEQLRSANQMQGTMIAPPGLAPEVIGPGIMAPPGDGWSAPVIGPTRP